MRKLDIIDRVKFWFGRPQHAVCVVNYIIFGVFWRTTDRRTLRLSWKILQKVFVIFRQSWNTSALSVNSLQPLDELTIRFDWKIVKNFSRSWHKGRKYWLLKYRIILFSGSRPADFTRKRHFRQNRNCLVIIRLSKSDAKVELEIQLGFDELNSDPLTRLLAICSFMRYNFL